MGKEKDDIILLPGDRVSIQDPVTSKLELCLTSIHQDNILGGAHTLISSACFKVNLDTIKSDA